MLATCNTQNSRRQNVWSSQHWVQIVDLEQRGRLARCMSRESRKSNRSCLYNSSLHRDPLWDILWVALYLRSPIQQPQNSKSSPRNLETRSLNPKPHRVTSRGIRFLFRPMVPRRIGSGKLGSGFRSWKVWATIGDVGFRL